MNAWETALAAAGIACTATYLLFVPRTIRIWRATHRPAETERAAQAAARVGLPPAAPDSRPGTDAAALDLIELIYADRLLDDIHNDQNNQGD